MTDKRVKKHQSICPTDLWVAIKAVDSLLLIKLVSRRYGCTKVDKYGSQFRAQSKSSTRVTGSHSNDLIIMTEGLFHS